MATVEEEIRERITRLEPAQRRQVLEYARALMEVPGRGVPGSALVRFSGSMAVADAEEIRGVVEAECEAVDPGAW